MRSKNSTGGTDASAPLPAPAKKSDLGTRVLSAVVLAPPVLGAVWLGGWAFQAVLALAGAICTVEWVRMVVPAEHRRAATLGFLVVVLGPLAVAVLTGDTRLGVLLGVVFMGSTVIRLRSAGARDPWLGAAGVPYLAVGLVALNWVRTGNGEDGLALFLFLLLGVWATDIGAYFAGKGIGGPKLMPSVSPKKTWAGLIGGMAAAAAVGYGVAAWFGAAMPWVAAAAGPIVAVVAQAGDLFESHAKRRGDVKDSGRLIPGHGGLLDRIDGLLSAAAGFALFHALAGESLAWW